MENSTTLNLLVSNTDNVTMTTATSLSPAGVWGYGFLFVTIINMSSIMGIVFFPLMNKSIYATVMRVMIGLAIGSLSGSAFFHLIPKALETLDGSHKIQVPVQTLLYVWITIWIVMFLESSMKIALKNRGHSHNIIDSEARSDLVNVNNNPIHRSMSAVSVDKNVCDDEELSGLKARSLSHQDGLNGKPIQNLLPIYRSTLSLKDIALEAARSDIKGADRKEIKTVAWVIIFGDALHNFVDGVSIGAAFCSSFQAGAVICLAIMCEEFPHELGDFAILINSGLTVKKALLFNFASALTCYLGLILGIVLGGFAFSNNIFAVAAGIFLYVALGDMVPEITEIIQEVSEQSKNAAWRVLLVHHAGILVGTTILYLLAIYLPE